jgi:chromosome segregation protein
LLKVSVEGFKTFAARTEIDLGSGLTAVVGPNGSGKSNLIDAIAWAVGDRSRKSLRGDGMDDLLFHGDAERGAASVARVTLSFSNEDRLLGIDFSEVVLTRELRRGEGSRVWLNGVEVRGKDALAVLSGTGLAGGFSLVRQGLVDKFVLGGPEDIGRWIEESANLSAYRARRKEAAERLGKVEANGIEAERKGAALRRELGQVRERASRARIRRGLDEERGRLRTHLAAWERERLRAALAALEVEAQDLRASRAEAERARVTLSEARARLEEELCGTPGMEKPPADRPLLDVGRALDEIRAAAGLLQEAAGHLSRGGVGSWGEAAGRLAKAVEKLRTLLLPGASAPDKSQDRLSSLRGLAAEDRSLEEESRRLGAALSAVEVEQARLEERRRGLGEGDAVAVAPDPERALRRLDAIERELATIGPVDETAEWREADLARELEALAPVLADLGSARSKLAGFIRQLDECTSRVFEETRRDVERRFASHCAVLFDGGEAALRVSGPPAPGADAAVEVRVKLPRKPDVPLTLLSGGERSLAGLALVLALAAGGGGAGAPSGRLLVLDEVDAALDEANAARLARLLRELESEHQILCVTHNKLTMRQASRLLGVTCGASTASRLLGVRLDAPSCGEPAA